MKNDVQVFGALMHGFATASIGLNIVAGPTAEGLVQNIDPNEWYPIEKWYGLQEIVLTEYEDQGPIMQKIGEEMMSNWYKLGPGKEKVKTGVEFLEFQTGSEGYYSVVKGTPEQIGDFALKDLDKESGKAVIYSTTPFNKDMERGVLIGGMKAPGDLELIDVSNDENPNQFNISFR